MKCLYVWDEKFTLSGAMFTCSSAGTCAVVTQWKRLGELHLVDTPTQCVFVCVQKVGVLGEMSVCLG